MAQATDVDVLRSVDLTSDIACECMLCHLPSKSDHDPIEWRIHLQFPGPYPTPGDTMMLLCTLCKDDWVDGDWDRPFDNLSVVRCAAPEPDLAPQRALRGKKAPLPTGASLSLAKRQLQMSQSI